MASDRHRLANRRDSRLTDFEHHGSAFTAGYSLTAAGDLGEMFVSAGKTGSGRDALCNDAAVLLSIVLQNGMPAADVARSLARLGFDRADEPASAIGAALGAVLADIEEEARESAVT